MREPAPVVVRLVVRPLDGFAWRIVFDDLRGPQAEHVASAEVTEEVVRRGAGALAPVAGPILRGRDTGRSGVEQEATTALGRLLFESPEVLSGLAAASGRAESLAQLLSVVVDAGSDPVIATVPWELLPVRPHRPALELTGRGTVVRLVAGGGQTAPPPAGALRVLVWAPEPEDATVTHVVGEVEKGMAGSGVTLHVFRSPGDAPASLPGVAEVFVVLCHGRATASLVHLLANGGSIGPGQVAHTTGPLIRRASLTVLAVCGAAYAPSRYLGGLVAWVGQAGAEVCVAPARALSDDAASAFLVTLVRALGTGDPLPRALAACRRALAQHADPHPDNRWCTPRVHVTGVHGAWTGPVVTLRWRPTGWPSLDPVAAAVVEAARDAAREQADGWVGVEHLLWSLHRYGEDLPGYEQIRQALPTIKRLLDVDRSSRRVHPGVLPPPGVTVTRGLTDLGAALPAGAGPADLAEALVRVAPFGLMNRLPTPPAAEVTGWTGILPAGPRESLAPPQGLRLVWGPLDGLVWIPRVGDTLGRTSTSQPVTFPLYSDTAWIDHTLPRSLALWTGTGLRVNRAVRLVRAGVNFVVGAGDVGLQPGDLVALGQATWAQVV